jgi:Protein of unknown function (DUF2510)
MTTLMGCLSLHLDSASAYDHGAERGRASGAGAQPVPRCHRSASRHPAAGWGGCVLVEERAMDTQDDQPKGPPPGDGTAQLPGWYPDPAGGWGQRWWDGARWTEHTTAAPPAAPPPALKPKGALEKVFQVEFVLAAIAIIPFFLTLLSSAGVHVGSLRRSGHHGHAVVGGCPSAAGDRLWGGVPAVETGHGQAHGRRGAGDWDGGELGGF